jgi:hypothetical protein
LLVGSSRRTNIDVSELDVEVMIDVTANSGARFDDLLQLDLHEIVVGVNVLFHQSFDLEECGEQIPFVPRGIDWVGQTLVIVEWFQERIKWIPRLELWGIWIRLWLRLRLSGRFRNWL